MSKRLVFPVGTKKHSLRGAATLGFSVIDDILIIAWSKPNLKLEYWDRKNGSMIVNARMDKIENLIGNKINQVEGPREFTDSDIGPKYQFFRDYFRTQGVPTAVINALNWYALNRAKTYFKDKKLNSFVVYGDSQIYSVEGKKFVSFVSWELDSTITTLREVQDTLVAAQMPQAMRLDKKIKKASVYEL